MARKRNQGTFEDLIDIVALLPWWVELILAVTSYFWLHHLSLQANLKDFAWQAER